MQQVLNRKPRKTNLVLNIIDTLLMLVFGFIALSHRHAIAAPEPFLIPTVSPQPLPEKIPDTIVISKFEIVGNTVLPDTTIQEAVKPYLLRPLTFIELLEVQQAITNLYVERGYITTGARIPPQTIANRTVTVEIVEGKISEIQILGLTKLHPEYIRSRIAIATTPPLNQDRLITALQLLKLNPLIETVSAELAPGLNPGESWLRLEVQEAKAKELRIVVDNDSVTSIGGTRSRILYRDRNFFGFGDALELGYSRTDGSESWERIQYVVPLGARGTSLRLSHNYNDSDIIVEPFVSLDLGSVNRGYEATLIQSLIAQPDQELYVGLAFTHQNTQFSLMDRGFPTLARGSDPEGRTILSTIRLVQEYISRGETHFLALSSQFAIGIDAFEATINSDNLPDSKYLLWRGGFNYLQALSPKTNLNVKLGLQFANESLFTQEQLTLGGVDTVRGYVKDRFQGDNGFYISTEINHTIWRVPQWNLALEISPFWDFGRIWNTDDFELPGNNIVSSLGIGANLTIGDRLKARIDYGIPLIKDKLEASAPESDALQDRGIYFSLDYQAF